jgi:hypothetical protein
MIMNRLLKIMLLLGGAKLLADLAKRLLRQPRDGERPTIRIRNGSIAMTVDSGDFQQSGLEWYPDGAGRTPRVLTVTLTGSDCDGQSFTCDWVDVVYVNPGGVTETVRIELRRTGSDARTFVVPVPNAAQKERPGGLAFRKGAAWTLHSVRLDKGQSCSFTTRVPEVVIRQTWP